MAGTPVRSFGRSLAVTLVQPLDWRARAGALGERRFDADYLLLAIVVVQLVATGLLIAHNALDLGVAACLSAGLVAAAALYAARRIGSAEVMPLSAEPAVATEALAGDKAEVPQLQSMDASEAWADLMARISHEIRTPLNAVIGFSDLMEREIFGPLGHARYGDYAAHIRDSGEALLKSAEDTLALSSLLVAPQAGDRPNIFDLTDIVWDAWRPLEAQAARRGVSLRIKVGSRIEVLGERRVCRQAFLNLLTEALNRAADHDHIEVAVLAMNDTVRLSFATATASQWRHETTPSLAVCLARTLLERAGSRLAITEDRSARTWAAVTMLERPIQDDFFSTGG